MDGAVVHVLVNRLLEGIQCGATTTESGREGVCECRIEVRWWPTLKQIFKRPKTRYEVERPTWQEAYDAVTAWIEREYGQGTTGDRSSVAEATPSVDGIAPGRETPSDAPGLRERDRVGKPEGNW